MSEQILNIINSLPSLIAQGGYWLISIIVILEGIPVLGSFFPGHVAIIAAGFLAKVGILSLPLVLVVTIISAILGDYIGFFVGRRYGYDFLTKFAKYVFIKESHLEKAKSLIDIHTGKSLIIGRFSPLTRPLAPFIVGASGASLKTFSIFNIIGAVTWIVVSVLVGYAFGASYAIASEFLGAFIVVALIVTILILWGYRFVNLRFHLFRKYELFVLILNLVALWGLAKTIQDAFSSQPFLVNLDQWVSLFVLEKVPDYIQSIALFFTNIGSTEVLAFLGFAIGLIFLIRQKWRRAVIMFVSIALTSMTVVFLKELVARVRPDNFIDLANNSFPSGHAALSAAFFVALAYILASHIDSWIKREVIIVACVLLTFVIGLSRILLNVHWFSDVVAGWSLGIFLATGSILLVRYLGMIFVREEK